MAILVIWSNLWCYIVPTPNIWAKSIPQSWAKLWLFFPKRKMAAAVISYLQKWWFSPRFLLQGVILHHLTKIDENPPIHGVEMALWLNSQWRSPPSWILVRWHLWSCDPIYGAIFLLRTKFEPNPSILGEVMAIFSKIQDGRRPPFWNCNHAI